MKICWNVGKLTVFIAGIFFREAENLLRRFTDDISPMKITAEYARVRQNVPRLPSSDLDFLNDAQKTNDQNELVRNVLELNKRYRIEKIE